MSETEREKHDNRVHITDAFCRSATVRPGKAMTVYTDTKLQGFCLVVTKGGAKTFACRFTLKDGDEAGKQARVTLGPYLASNGKAVATYRTEAAKIIGDAARGIDRAAKKRAARKGATVAELCERYLKEHAPAKRSADLDRRRIEGRILPAWKARKASSITRGDVKALLAPIEFGDGKEQRAAPYEAWGLLRLIKKLFNFAIDCEIVETNPAARMKLATAPEARERSLDRADELRAFWELTDGDTYMPAAYAAALRFQLLTGSRPGEIVGMAWDELDLEADEWTLPKARNKNKKRDHLLPLTPTLRAIIDTQGARWAREQAARKAEGKPPRKTRYVFPALRGGRYTDRCRALMLDAALDAYTKAGHTLARFTPHDLRRTATTIMVDAGVPQEHRNRVTNHVDRSVEGQHYNKAEYKPEKRAALETLERAIEARLAGKPSNVTSIRRKA